MSTDTIFEGYEKLKTVGKGAFGTATLYKRLNDGKHVVMKEIYLLDMDGNEKKSALNEVQILSNLNHPNIIRYLGNFEKDGSLIIIMEYADGGNLAQLINAKKKKNETFSEKGILHILSQISSALAYMHKCKILHRDLKTANIFLNSNGTVKVGDFGISKMLNTKSQAQTVIGTPYYLSPEMCEGSDYNEKSDIWAMGCILYELACLKKPFEAPTLPVLVQKITQCEFEDIPKTYSQELSKLVRSILQKSIEGRPSAKYMQDTVVPNIMKTTLNGSFTSFLNTSLPRERMILYEISNFGQDQQITPIELPHKKIIDFSCSLTHQIAITSDNLVYTWGENTYGQLALGEISACKKHPCHVSYLKDKKIVKCAAGQGFSLLLNETGVLFSCGNGSFGCLGHGDWNSITFPSTINCLITTKIIGIFSGTEHVCALTINGNVYSWGSSKNGQLGHGHYQYRCKPLLLNLGHSIKNIYCGYDCTVLLTENGQILAAGNNTFNKLGIGQQSFISLFTVVRLQIKIKDVAIGENHTAFLAENHTILMVGKRFQRQTVKIDSKLTAITAGQNFTAALDYRNVLWFWGSYKPHKQSKTRFLQEEDINDFEFVIRKPEVILALYSSKNNVEKGCFVNVERIVANNNTLFVLVYTTVPPPIKQFNSQEDTNDFIESNLSYTTNECVS